MDVTDICLIGIIAVLLAALLYALKEWQALRRKVSEQDSLIDDLSATLGGVEREDDWRKHAL